MKAKFKGLGGVKGLMLLHGEKILMGVSGIAAAVLVFSAFKAERLPDKYEPEKLQTQVRATKASIEDTAKNNWTIAVREHPDKIRVVTDQIEKRDVITVPYEVWKIGQINPIGSPATQSADRPCFIGCV